VVAGKSRGKNGGLAKKSYEKMAGLPESRRTFVHLRSKARTMERNSTYECIQTVSLSLNTPPSLFIFHLKATTFSIPALIFPWIAVFLAGNTGLLHV
jgi:hypothetical protein